MALAILAATLCASAGLALVGLATPAPRGLPSDFARPNTAPTASDTVALVLALVPSPPSGPAPFWVNVTASVQGGVAPYNLSVCFATADHSSPPATCADGVSGWNGDTPQVFSHYYASPGNYSVLGLATDSQGEGVGSTALIRVTVAPTLIVSAVEQSSAGPAPLLVTFNESISGDTGPISLSWAFGDGTNASAAPGASLSHVYRDVGTFLPTLTVTDAAGHHSVEGLPAITVTPSSTPPQGIVGGISSATFAELLGAFAVAALVVAVVVHQLQVRRWKQEGNDLVAWLRQDAEPPLGTIRPP
ncbi:MAG: PKD domain-containing protein [Thermoplasmata archaeon]|nr:PKD domain-containing protein [Thermoplasmata archaeon]